MKSACRKQYNLFQPPYESQRRSYTNISNYSQSISNCIKRQRVCHSCGTQRDGNTLYGSIYFLFTELWCEPVWDSLLCWPPTKASTTAKQRCPYEDGFDTTSKYDATYLTNVHINCLLMFLIYVQRNKCGNIGK